MITGRIVAVEERHAGSNLSADAGIGVGSLVVDLVGLEFEETGGTLQVMSEGVVEEIDYSSADPDTDTITLVGTLTAAHVTGDRVEVVPAVVERVAHIMIADIEDEAVLARVPHSLFDRIPEGIREDGAGESVLLEYQSGELALVDPLGKEPTIDAGYLDTSENPVPITDGEPPSASPAAVVEGGPGYFAVSWDAAANVDSVTYAVHVSATTGFTPDGSTLAGEVSGTRMFVRRLPDGEPFIAGTDYYFKIVASDGDGAADAGTQGSAMLVPINSDDIAVDAIRANHILSGEITAEKLAAVMVLASTLMTAEAGQRVVIDASGVAMFNAAEEQLVSIPTDGDPFFRATIEALGLDVLGKFTLRGQNNVIEQGATITLRDKTADPAAAPIVSSFYNYLELALPDGADQSSLVGLDYDPEATASFWTAFFNSQEQLWYIGEFNATTGALITSDDRFLSTAAVHAVKRVGSTLYVLVTRINGLGQKQIYLQRHSASGLGYLGETNVDIYVGARDIATLADYGGNVAVVTRSGSHFVANEFNSSGSHVGSAGLSTDAGLTSSLDYYTTGAILVSEGGVDYWFIASQTSGRSIASVRVFRESDGVEQDAMAFFGESSVLDGLAHNGTRFFTHGGSYRLSEHSNFKPAGSKLYVRYAYENSGGQTTAKSPLMAAQSPKQRAYMRVTVPDIPSSLQDSVIYAGLHASAEPTLYQQSAGAAKTTTLPEALVVSGDTAPTASTLASGTAATFESEDGSPLLTSKGYSRAKIRSSGQNLTTASETTIDFSALDGVDTDGYWDGSADYVILPFTGQYEVIAQISFEGNSSGRRYLKLQTDASSPYTTFVDYAPNGDGFASALPVGVDRATCLIDAMVDAITGTAIRVRAYQNSGGTLATNCRLTVVYLGPS